MMKNHSTCPSYSSVQWGGLSLEYIPVSLVTARPLPSLRLKLEYQVSVTPTLLESMADLEGIL